MNVYVTSIGLAFAVVATACGEKDAGSSSAGSAAASTGSAVAQGSGAGLGSGSGSGSGSATAAGSAAVAPRPAPATYYGAPVPALTAPAAPPADPPTVESLHVEQARALFAWMKDPKARELYATDFAGRHEPDGRVALVPYDAFITGIPAAIDVANPSIKTWLDRGESAIEDGEIRVNFSYDHTGGDEYREQTWRRVDGKLLLVKEQVNSRNSHDVSRKRLRNFLSTDATKLGKTIGARLRIEGPLVWIVLEDEKHQQAVVDVWPEGACAAAPVSPDRKDVAALLSCPNVGDGQEFAFVPRKGELSIQVSPVGKTAPMSTDRTIRLPPNAKLAFAP